MASIVRKGVLRNAPGGLLKARSTHLSSYQKSKLGEEHLHVAMQQHTCDSSPLLHAPCPSSLETAGKECSETLCGSLRVCLLF
jgi:hypothetical protein